MTQRTGQRQVNTERHRKHFDSPIGRICMEEEDEALTALYPEREKGESKDCGSAFLVQVQKEVEEYFRGERKTFDFPVRYQGTEFQKAVWDALRRIPYGVTFSYSELAAAIDRPKACRAVGGANHANRILIVVPCHRVIGKSGKLVGFGCGLEVKEYLLALESGQKTAAVLAKAVCPQRS